MKETFLKRIEELSAAYTPEWRFRLEEPDIGSALAFLYAEMMEDTTERYHHTWEQHKRLFYNYLKAEPLCGTPASGYLVCSLSSTDMPEAVVNAGMQLTAKNTEGQKQEYKVIEDIYVSSISITDFFESGGQWYLIFDKAPVNGTVQLLFMAEKEHETFGQTYEFTYHSPVGWKELMIQDETKGFCRMGRVLFMGNPRYQITSFLDRNGFFIRISPQKGSVLPTALPKVFINAGKVEALNPGSEGNMFPGSGIKLERTIGFVTKLSNPDAWCMGASAESEERCMERYGARVRHQFRAITPKDFERLCFEACQNLQWTKCYPGYSGKGEKSPGAVTVVALQKDYLEGRRYFYKLREQIEEYLVSRAGAGIRRIYVIAPWFVWIDIHAVIYADSYQHAMDVKRRVEEVLKEYLNPVTGGNDSEGWSIGMMPRALQIKQLLGRQPHVIYVSQLCINVWLDKGDGRTALDLETVRALPFVLPLSGTHDIVIDVG